MAGEPLSAVIKDAPRFFSAIAPRYRALLALQSRLAWSESKRRYLAFAFLFGLSALAVMGQLQSILAAMHLPGETSFDVGDLAFPDRSDAAVTTWTAHAAETTAKFSGPLLVTVVFALVDSLVLVPAYALFLAIASAEAHQRLAAAYTAEQAKPAETRDPLLKTYRRLAAAAFLSVPLLVATDLLENAGFVAVVAWKGDAPDLVVWLLAAVSALKWLLAGGIVVALLFAAVALARRSGARGRGFLQTAAVLRIEIFVALVLAVFLFGPIAAEQMDDVIRRWIGPDWNELLTGSLLALLLSAVIAAVSWRLLVLQ